MNRLQVARAIIRKIAELIHSDSEAVADLNVVEIPLKKILEKKKGVCQQYAALFQGLSRSLGIPARVIAGYDLGTDFAGGHAWVEVKLDGKTWWPMEPQEDSDGLPDRTYFPTSVFYPYLAHTEQEMESFRLQETRELVTFFRKISADGTVATFPRTLGH
jgi:transglutaminase-like putative cysteine protease